MKLLITFLLDFTIIYLLYYFFLRRKKKYSKKRFADVVIFESYYNIDVKKIGYKKVLSILNFVNALMLSLLILLVSGMKNNLLIILSLTLIMVPAIWFVYYLLSKYFKYLERKN